VFFNGKAATVVAASATEITAAVPIGAGTGNVTVSINSGTPISGPVFTYQLSAVVTTIAGNDKQGYIDGKGANASFFLVWGLTIDPTGNIYVSDGYYIRKVTPDGTVSTIAGNSNGNTIGWDKDGKGNAATFLFATGIATDNSGNVYITDGSLIRKMTPDGTVSTLSVNNSLFPTAPNFTGIVLDASGNIYASDNGNNLIMKLTPGGTSSIFAGNGTKGSMDGQGTSASFNDPLDLGIDGSGNIFITDLISDKIRKLTPGGLVTTVAGNGSKGASNGPAAQASFFAPDGVAADKSGNLYISDYGNNLIRKIASDGTVSTVAGTGQIGNPQVDGIGTAASFASADELKVDAAGNIYIADYNKIRKITFQ
jgi:sugar lactone lactonase YvrE